MTRGTQRGLFCAKRSLDLATIGFSGFEPMRCLDCGGLRLDEASGLGILGIPVAEWQSFQASLQSAPSRDSEMRCPACSPAGRQAVEVDGKELDYCPSCFGIFFEAGELEALSGRAPSEDPDPMAGLRISADIDRTEGWAGRALESLYASASWTHWELFR